MTPLKLELPVILRRRFCPPRHHDALSINRESFLLSLQKIHYLDLLESVQAGAAPDGTIFLFGQDTGCFFGEWALEHFITYLDQPEVFFNRDYLPLPSLPPDLLTGTRPWPEDQRVMITINGTGGLKLYTLPHNEIRPLMDFIRFLPPQRLSLAVVPAAWTAPEIPRGRQAEKKKTPPQPAGPKPVKPLQESPPGQKAPRPEELDNPISLDAGGIISSQELSRQGEPGSPLIKALSTDSGEAWFALFLQLHQDNRKLQADQVVLDAQICLINALWKDRSLGREISSDPELNEWTRQCCPLAWGITQTGPDRELPPLKPDLSIKARWLIIAAGAARRYDYFWAFAQREVLLNELNSQPLQYGRDMPGFIEKLEKTELISVLETTRIESQRELQHLLSRIETLSPEGRPLPPGEGKFLSGNMADDEMQITREWTSSEQMAFMGKDPEKIFELNYVSALYGLHRRCLSEGPDGEASNAYFSFLRRLGDWFALNHKNRFFKPILIMRHELQTNILHLAGDPRFRTWVQNVLNKVQHSFLPAAKQNLEYRAILYISIERVWSELQGDLNRLARVARESIEQKNQVKINQFVLMELLHLMLPLGADEKLQIMTGITGRVARAKELRIPSILADMKRFLGSVEVDRDSFLGTYRRWEKWRIRKVIEEDIRKIRAMELIFHA